MLKFNLFCALLICLIFFSCSSPEGKVLIEEPLQLTYDQALILANLPLKCLQKEFPNKLNQSLGNPEEIGTPKELHPVFYGCYDWHSSVHGHWLLVHLLRKFPNHSKSNEILTILSDNVTKENVEIELNYFKRESEKSFERPYGWAWLLKLQEELNKWDHEKAKELSNNLQPLSDFIVNKYIEFLPRLNYPVRGGEHSNTAFGLSLAYDYALHFKHSELKNMIELRSKKYYGNDKDCPMTWEPSGFDFLSPCLQEAELMSKILSKDEFKNWFNQFLPQFTDQSIQLAPADVSDRTDGKLVHLDGANFCRAWSLYRIVKSAPEYIHLNAIANNHVKSSLPMMVDGSYEGEHWLASFAALALSQE